MRKKHLDLHQRVLNAAASQAVENVKAQHTNLEPGSLVLLGPYFRTDARLESGLERLRDPV